MFGLPDLKIAEYTQLEVGNQLLFATLLCVLEISDSGGIAVVEHPADAGPSKPSIFKTTPVRRLLQLPHARSCTFLQGKLGQVMPKPTTCLTVRLPLFARAIHQFSTDQCRRNGGAQFDEHGNFATAEAKTYQPRFCGAIACSIAHAVISQTACELQGELLFRELKSRFLGIVDFYESYGQGTSDFVPPVIPSGFTHHAEVQQLLEWNEDDHVRGADFNLASLVMTDGIGSTALSTTMQ